MVTHTTRRRRFASGRQTPWWTTSPSPQTAEAFRGIRSCGAIDGIERVRAYAVKLRPGEEVSHAPGTRHDADALLRRKRPILRLGDLRAAVDRWEGRRGVVALRRALDRARERTDSVAETELTMDAEDAGLPEFEVNGEIFDERGVRVAFGDLVDRERRVLLEYDGEQHRLDDAQYARDIERLEVLARLGWRVMRVNKSHRGPCAGASSSARATR